MADQFMEQMRPEARPVDIGPIEVASRVRANPDHQQYTADRAVARVLCNGISGIIAAMDGVGSGGQDSAQAAEIMQKILYDEIQLENPPTINQAVELLKQLISDAAAKIRQLQKDLSNPNVDTTISVGIVCWSPDRRRCFLVTANVGDSRIYRYRPETGELDQLTVDHSVVQRLVDEGIITSDEAFTHPDRNLVYRTVGLLNDPKKIDIKVVEVQPGDIFFAASDGLSDNITRHGLPFALHEELLMAYDPRIGRPNLQRFASDLAQKAINIMSTEAEHAKLDDVCVAVLRVPRNN